MSNAGGQDLDSEGFWTFISEAMLLEMGPVDCVSTWRSTNGSTMLSRLDRFVCLIETVELFLLVDVRSLSRPLSDHTLIVWTTNEGQRRSTYFKVDKSWLIEVGFKEEVERAWSSHVTHGYETKRLVDKIEGVRKRLMLLQKHIREERSKWRHEALTRIKQLDNLEDR